jgi:hypothetical protein
MAPNETISLLCACGKKLKVPTNLVGKKAKCPGCLKVFIVPPPKSKPEPPQEPAEKSANNEQANRVFQTFIQSVRQTTEKESPDHVVGYGFQDRDFSNQITKVVERRSKRGFPKIEDFVVYEQDDSTMLHSWTTRIYLTLHKTSAFKLTAICHGEVNHDKLLEFDDLYEPKPFVDAFNAITKKIKAPNLMHHLVRIGELDPEFATLLYEFLTRTKEDTYALECRLFFFLWDNIRRRICANWANPECVVFGSIESVLRVRDFKNEPRNAILQSCGEAAVRDGHDINSKKTMESIGAALATVGEINF